MKVVQIFHCFFKWICVIIAFSMAGFWVRKYLKDEDITVIEYIAYNNSDSVTLPSMFICFANSFPTSNESLGNSTEPKSKRYSKYLRGDEEFYDDYWMSLFGRNAWSISDYLVNITVFHYLKNKKHTEAMETFPSLSDCPFITFENNFNGFNNGSFARCFELKVKVKYSRFVSIVALGFKKKF